METFDKDIVQNHGLRDTQAATNSTVTSICVFVDQAKAELQQ